MRTSLASAHESTSPIIEEEDDDSSPMKPSICFFFHGPSYECLCAFVTGTRPGETSERTHQAKKKKKKTTFLTYSAGESSKELGDMQIAR